MIECSFTCLECGAKRAPFKVRIRGKFEKVTDWVHDAVQPAMNAAHRSCSPTCRSTKADLWLPNNPKGIGFPTEH